LKEIAFALDIRDDPDAIRAYRNWHKKVWPEIMRGTAEIGVQSQRIYLSGNRLFMILQVEDELSKGFCALPEGHPAGRRVGGVDAELSAAASMG
jgi:L-rhamnose mutarotase